MKTAQLIQTAAVVGLVLGIISLFNSFAPDEEPHPIPAKRDCSLQLENEQNLLEKYEASSNNLDAAAQSLKQMLKTCERQNQSRFERRAEREAYCMETDPALQTLEESIANLRDSTTELSKQLEKASEESTSCQG
ncbi:MAG: hypothetical protein KDD66_13775 [Bdellovibrionales bacterium]|nr:hypothetical protein [Bdellovibrionales bacterium]